MHFSSHIDKMKVSANKMHCERNINWFVLIFMTAILLTGCAAKMGATRSLPPTAYPSHLVFHSFNIKKIQVAIEPFDVERTEISGGHHEGLAQVRQPWIWGLSDDQKEAMYGDLKNVARYAFIDEFNRIGLRVIVPEEHQSMLTLSEKQKKMGLKDASIIIRGSVKSIEMNTYGHGLSGSFEGFGSAGNYWEAEILLSDITICDKHQNILWRGDLKKYSKLLKCPVKLDWTMFTLLSKSLQSANMMSSSSKMASGIKSSGADYIIEGIKDNPVEMAARLAAIDIIHIIDDKLSN